MAKNISFLNPKGGCGKTTLSINVAQGLQLRGFEVIVGDGDPQGSARNWLAASGDSDYAPIYGVDKPKLVPGLTKISADKDFVIFDGPATDMDISTEGILIADLVIIPVNPSPFDVWACGGLVEMIKTRQRLTNGRPASMFLFTRQKAHTKLSRDVRSALDKQGLDIFKSSTCDREIYKQAVGMGKSIFETNNEEAKIEMNEIIDEIIAVFEHED